MSIDRTAAAVSSERVRADRARCGRRFWSDPYFLRAVGGLSVGLAVLFAPPAWGRDPEPRGAVTLAEVASRVDSPRLGNVVELLRRDVESELAAIDWKTKGVRRRVAVSASVVHLDSVRDKSGLKASCTVSATLRDEKSGALLAILEGRALAEDRPTAAAQAERGALAGAVRGAVAAIPEAIRRVQK